MRCGLLGYRLGHSYSPTIHSQFADYRYDLFDIAPDRLGAFFKNGDYSGLNVTMPYKKEVIAYLDDLTPEAEKLGAVNTIIRSSGKLIGHNTDYFGFLSMVQCSGIDPVGKKCLVLGSGGAGTTVRAVLQDLGADVITISRSGQDNYSNLQRHTDAAILINATPVGMFPNTEHSPVDLCIFPSLEFVFDLIYNPARTTLLMQAENNGIPHQDGLWMLVAQAKAACEKFTGQLIPDEKIRKVYHSLRRDKENIILIGMPGCGKTSVGQHLSSITGREFADSDAIVEQLAGKSIPQIFSQDGEDCFRQLEAKVLAQLGKRSGLVISTGGGCVTRQENYASLHQNGQIFWLQQDIHLLSTTGRPISQNTNLEELFSVREPMYQRFADHQISNNASIDECANRIWEVFA